MENHIIFANSKGALWPVIDFKNASKKNRVIASVSYIYLVGRI